MTKSVRAVVSGRVQGVWFRASTRDKACELGLAGHVRNLPNGDVEFVAKGGEQRVDELIAWAWHGPTLARVTQVKVDVLSDEQADGVTHADFKVRY